MESRLKIAFRCFAALLLACLAATPALAQTWEYSPYNIRVWVAVDPELNAEGLAEEIGRDVATGARLAAGVVWRIFPAPAPAALQVDLLTRIDSLSPEQLLAADPDAFRVNPQAFPKFYVAASGDQEQIPIDKLVIIVVAQRDAGIAVRVRELDVATRQWGDLRTAITNQLAATPGLALANFLTAIRPLAKVERVQGSSIFARVRASGLITDETSPAAIREGQVMAPVVRRNQRNGEPMKNGIYAPAWSYVAVDARTETTISGKLSSGYGRVIPAKGGPRTERLLLGLTPQHPATRLELRARVASSPGKGLPPPGRLLPGYEVHVKNIGEEKTELVGLTDWEGGIDLQPGTNPLRLFYIKNGGQLVARLPLVVGHQPRMTANVLDDDPRLAAESYIKSLQSRVTDLVARREVLAVRARAKVAKGDIAAARKLVEEYRSLTTSAQLTRELEETKRRMSNVGGINGKRIDKLFLDAHKLLQGFLDPAAADKLAAEIEGGGKGAPPTAATPEPAETAAPAIAPAT